ncbi:discoidin domain-containing protein [Bacteroidota bacterium]
MKHLRLLPIGIVLMIQLNAFSQNDRVVLHGDSTFISGMNLAWIDFAQDLTQFDVTSFTQALNDVAQAGGNSLRWWVHVNGRYSPQWQNDTVSGISETELNNLEKALDLATERNIVVSICLWSFDMLQDNAGAENHARNMKLLNDSAATQAYINNALLPMVRKVKGHMAIMCWEIFNEPEGMTTEFGWTPERVSMASVQSFINLCAGAIHTEAEDELVSNGSWSFKASSDRWTSGGTDRNYYSDTALIAKGGDAKGILDFYMVHYYDWGGTTLSPFHHPASYWGLDKPLVIGEFSAIGPTDDIGPEEAYNYLYDNGYAGAMAWTWTNHDGHGGVDEAAPGMQSLFLNHSLDIVLNLSDGNHVPLVKKKIPNALLSMTAGEVDNYCNLYTIFYDFEDSVALTYAIDTVSNSSILTVEIDEDNNLDLNISGDSAGFAYVQISATDSAGVQVLTGFGVNVYDPDHRNLALYKDVVASTTEDYAKLPEYAVDGDMSTRWSSLYENNQYLIIDLGEEYNVGIVKLFWEVAYTSEYDIELSSDGSSWEKAYATTEGSGGNEVISFKSTPARYIRLRLRERATEWGHSLWEVEVYSVPLSAEDILVKNTGVLVYPNPTDRSFSLRSLKHEMSINSVLIYNLSGSLIKRIEPDDSSSNQQVKILIEKPGVYMARIHCDESQVFVKKIIVN